MLRYFIIEILLPLLLFLVLRSFLKGFFQNRRDVSRRDTHSQPAPNAPPPVFAGGDLKKDPVCGTYVSTSASVTRTVNGELLHFCSKECRDKYRAA
jgi:YHS domain-containing protein